MWKPKKRILDSSRLSVLPSARVEQLGLQLKNFHEILHMSIFRKSMEKIQISLKYDKNDGYFTWKAASI
jgi:hypothetical protein